MLIRGDHLTPRQRSEALAMFVHRNTTDHPFPPAGGTPHGTDGEWLAAHAFHVRQDGRLMHRHARPACFVTG